MSFKRERDLAALNAELEGIDAMYEVMLDNAELERQDEERKKDRAESVNAVIPAHRVVNVATRACDTCGRWLLYCECPTYRPCTHCGLDCEDAEAVGPVCEYSIDGLHDWREEEG